MAEKANLAGKLAACAERSAPRTVAEFNGRDVMVAGLEGPVHRRSHAETDDFLGVPDGAPDIGLRGPGGERTLMQRPGEVFVVPNGVEHRRGAQGEVHVLLIARTGPPNTGDPATGSMAAWPDDPGRMGTIRPGRTTRRGRVGRLADRHGSTSGMTPIFGGW